MKTADLRTLVSCSRQLFPGWSPHDVNLQVKFISAGLREAAVASHMFSPAPGTALDRIMAERPQLLGALVWPYQCAMWAPRERLQRIVGHYDVVDSLPAAFSFSCDERLVLADLESLHPGLKLVLDQPEWFLREGGLTINLFLDSFRAFSVAFSFMRAKDGTLCATIGGIQGRNRDGMLDTYREITRSLYGLRPRDFLIEALRILCRLLQVDFLLAVSEVARHQRHPYFKGSVPLSQEYDSIWRDRGGVPQDPQFFVLPLAAGRRNLAEVKSNKRPMYRRRFGFLDDLEAKISHDLPDLRPVRFADS